MTYGLAPGIVIEDSVRGSFLVSARPLRMVRLNPALLKLTQRMLAAEIEATSAAETTVLESLVKSGFVVRHQNLADLAQLPAVSIVIPVKDRAADLRQCLNSLKELNYPSEILEVVVVDDGSSDDSPKVATELGALLVRSGAVGGGPALARNKGASVASGEILAFIDSDCSASVDWLADLLPAFNDVSLAAVGGWVAGMFEGSALDRYEAVMSSLNLGRREMSGGAGGDTFYLPSCNLLMRKSAFAAAGGFNPELQVGEDVDLTWRLRDAGWKIQYLPQGTVYHAHRCRTWPFMKRRFDYGTSEGLLQQLHPVRAKKMLLPPMLTGILLLLVAALATLSLLPLPIAALLLLSDTALTRQRMSRQGLSLPWGKIIAARIRAVGSLGYYLGYHLLRYYLTPLLLTSALYPPCGVALLVMFLGVGLVDFRVRKPKMYFPGFCFYYLLEQLSYGSGVFWGCSKMKNFASYRLTLIKA
ncbi:mycofactocin biosynthesis glycosyltransferase MftF [Geopsychrobacter electrodiphilus]|uniref:mycofactocin biosynthesis glycosyltransferase MftF n=1 Tax=Geopsychrobacter electrodiphilus TaxID=225196 RepID=UPI00037EAD6B|nr:mycofactocin biosynthesis glycosyltransferase MftF [Geopsychrobacter electrodiphilus]